jgi:hypothetical protein
LKLWPGREFVTVWAVETDLEQTKTSTPIIQDQETDLLRHAKPDDRARVQLACKILDKILRDVRDEEPHRLDEKPVVAMQINGGLKRGRREFA